MKQNAILVASAKKNSLVVVGDKSYFHKIESFETEFQDSIKDLILQEYKENEEYVNDLLFSIYGKPVKFSSNLCDFLIRIKSIISQTGKRIENIIIEIRNYLGYNCSFFRYVNNKFVPVNTERILKAYELVQKKSTFLQVENALYL